MMPNLANVAATLMEHLCVHANHGYTQSDGRWGTSGFCTVPVDGETYKLAQGDRDCSSAVIDCWKQAIKGTPYEGKLDAATYTGNMKQVFTASGLFEWKPMTYIAQRGDIYLNHVYHTAMCTSAVPDRLAEFYLNEFGGIVGGRVGDQTGGESRITAFYNPSYGWDGILHYNGKADKEDDMATASDVWGYKNEKLETVDAYQILRDCRDMLEELKGVKSDVAELKAALDAVRGE